MHPPNFVPILVGVDVRLSLVTDITMTERANAEASFEVERSGGYCCCHDASNASLGHRRQRTEAFMRSVSLQLLLVSASMNLVFIIYMIFVSFLLNHSFNKHINYSINK